MGHKKEDAVDPLCRLDRQAHLAMLVSNSNMHHSKGGV
jgi:hypothetical protein